ncbi:GNAT family N-acetyltransferase [Primorskyibacter sp. 2E107]|uniref:GNAT family N-acetyltransferase n=1 Tax=Primorskyibacter sp. 2E107 TaxID=3403458 RepID=UPI003AF685A7
MTHPYNSRAYAQTLPGRDPVHMSDALGVPLRLRTIPGTDRIDACGAYPISPDLRACSRAALRDELSALGVVSLVLVSDPFCADTPQGFDFARPYKPHHTIVPGDGPVRFSKHHRAEVRRALRHCAARRIPLADHLAAFIGLYDTLSARHGLGAQHRFSPAHFAHLAAHPEDFPCFGAFAEDGALLSAHIWVRAGDRLYSHLAASSEAGYGIGAAYAVYDASINSFAEHRITLGGAPDSAEGQQTSGLDRFKRGFANGSRSPQLCGLIVDRKAYAALAPANASAPPSGFFPLYRRPQGHK